MVFQSLKTKIRRYFSLMFLSNRASQVFKVYTWLTYNNKNVVLSVFGNSPHNLSKMHKVPLAHSGSISFVPYSSKVSQTPASKIIFASCVQYEMRCIDLIEC